MGAAGDEMGKIARVIDCAGGDLIWQVKGPLQEVGEGCWDM